MVAALPSSGVFAINRTKILLLVLLVACWSIAHIFPSYQDTIQTRIKAQLAATREKIPKIRISFNPNTDPRTAYNQSKVAVLIEGRAKPELVPHILHMIAVVPQDWRFLFIGSNKSVVSVSRSVPIKYQQASGKLDLLIVPEVTKAGNDGWDISNKEGVWRMLTDIRFYNDVLPGVEWMLKYESDSILCANSDQSLNDWLDYDWAAAPRTPNDPFAGNGGLSIRRLSAVKQILGFQAREPGSQPEDEWFGRRIISMPHLKIAKGDQASHFAVEDVYHEKPMGYHLRDGQGHLSEGVWKSSQQRADILKYCPDLSIILPMKLERERCEGDDREGKILPVTAQAIGNATPEEVAAAKAAEEEAKKAQREQEGDDVLPEEPVELAEEEGEEEEETHDDPVDK